MAPPPRPKRRRHSIPSSNASSSLDHHLESVFALSDPSVPFDLSLERILKSRVLHSDKEDLIHVSFRVGSALMDAASRSARKLAAAHNSLSWPLPPELTVKVLSFLDATSLCHASATCTTFSKCASDPLCYEDIDLTRDGHKVEDSVVSTMIQKAGKSLKSLKLGIESIFDSERKWRSCLLSRSCLITLSSDNGASGALLQKLSLKNVNKMDTEALILALSNCKSLIDLEIVGIIAVDLKRTLTAVSEHCPLIKRLCFDYSGFGRSPNLDISYFDDVIKNCNMFSSLAIRGCELNDRVLHQIMKKLSKLKYADFSSSIGLKGFFLKDLGNGDGGDSLETLILHDCAYLKKDAIGKFFNAILAGKWKSLRFLDVFSQYRIICGVELLHAVNQSRPEIFLIAQFNPQKYMIDTSSSSSDEGTQNGDGQEINSSSDDEDTQNGDEPNSDSSSDDSSSQDLVTQNFSSSTDSSSEDDVTQIDETNSDSSSEDEFTQIGVDHNLDSSSDDEVQDH